MFLLWTERWLQGVYLNLIRTQLEQQVQLLVPLLDPADPHLDGRVNLASQNVPHRLTIIDGRGRVLADSSFSQRQLEGMENHLNREEIVEAAEKGVGSSLRYSTSVEDELLYVALPFPDGGGFLRVATPLTDVRAVAADLRSPLVYRFLVLVAVWD